MYSVDFQFCRNVNFVSITLCVTYEAENETHDNGRLVSPRPEVRGTVKAKSSAIPEVRRTAKFVAKPIPHPVRSPYTITTLIIPHCRRAGRYG